LDRKSPEYKKLKAERCETLWKAIERVIPDVRSRVEVELSGSPLTHERFLNRPQGTYGPALAAGKAMFPGPGESSTIEYEISQPPKPDIALQAGELRPHRQALFPSQS